MLSRAQKKFRIRPESTLIGIGFEWKQSVLSVESYSTPSQIKIDSLLPWSFCRRHPCRGHDRSHGVIFNATDIDFNIHMLFATVTCLGLGFGVPWTLTRTLVLTCVTALAITLILVVVTVTVAFIAAAISSLLLQFPLPKHVQNNRAV